MKKKSFYIHFSIIIYFVAFFISTLYTSDFWGDILSPIGSLIAFIMLFYVFKKSTSFKLTSILLALSALAWTITDISWAVCEIGLGLNPEEISIFDGLYFISNIFITLAGVLYFFKILRNLNLIQLFIDIMAISLSGISIFWIVLMNKSTNTFFNNRIIFMSMITDCAIIVGSIIFLFSTRKGRMQSGSYITILGGGSYAIIDLLYSYVYFYNSYVPNSVIDTGYIFAFLLMAYGGGLGLKQNNNLNNNTIYTEIQNIGTSYKSLILLVFPIILVVFKGLDYPNLVFLVSIYIIYQGLSNYVQKAIRNEQLLIGEKNMNLILEEKINERTNELVMINRNLEYITKHDIITQIYNGRYFKESLDEIIKTEGTETKIALIYIDLDRFKTINDTYGHDIGDEILIEVSERLAKIVTDNDLLARLGGDEFILAIKGDYTIAEVEKIVCDIIRICSEPIHIRSYQFKVTLSIGIAIFPKDGDTRSILMKNSDIAMYDAKSRGYNQYSFFNQQMNDMILEKHEIEMLLRNADYNKEFQLFYQPQININNDNFIGVEALIRWTSPIKGNIRPDKFIRIAEEIGCIEEISDWVMNEAARQIYEWNTKYNTNLKMGINISPLQLGNINFVDKLRSIIKTYKVPPEWLDIEITENIAMKGEVALEEVFTSIANLSITTSIDDFGTGYSSLSYIQKFSFERLKIAKELIDNISKDSSDNYIVEAIVMMAKALRITTIAEGVETYEQLEILRRIGCDEIQGYIFSKPMPAKELEDSFLDELFLMN